MARKTIFVSDLSGKEIGNDRDAVTITVKYGDARKGVIVVDAHPGDGEVKRLVQVGRQQARRGHRGVVIVGTTGSIVLDTGGYEVYDLKGAKTSERMEGKAAASADLSASRPAAHHAAALRAGLA